jgi:cephalosporin hydroxylase
LCGEWGESDGLELQFKNVLLISGYIKRFIHELKPDVIVETGTAEGGSASFFGSLFDLIGKGEIVTIESKTEKDDQIMKE